MDKKLEKIIPGQKFNKFVDSKLPDWGNFLEELEPKEEELDRSAIKPFANAFENAPKRKSRKKKKKEKKTPTMQDQIKQCLLNMIEAETKKWDGEIINTIATEEDLHPEFNMDNVRSAELESIRNIFRDALPHFVVIDRFRAFIHHQDVLIKQSDNTDLHKAKSVYTLIITDITNEEVVNKYEKMVAKCKCKDCIKEKEEYKRMLQIAQEPDGLDHKERMLMNALWSHKDRKYFRKKYELEKQEYGDPERWLKFGGINKEEYAVNLDDYKKKTDSDDEDPLINFSRSLEQFDLNFDPWSEEDENQFRKNPLFREFDQMFRKEV